MTRNSTRKLARISAGLLVGALAAATAIAQTYLPAEKKPETEEAPPAQSEPKPAAPEEKGAPAKARRAARAAKPAAPAPTTPEPSALVPLAWLQGCWSGTVNRREYREHWLPLRGNLLVGVSHTVSFDKTQDFEYLRLESRPGGIYYVAVPSGQAETSFKLTEQRVDREAERDDEIFVFTNPALEFPGKITYRRGTGGWLYVTLDGKVKGADRQVVYPMRRINCESGEILAR